MSLASRCGEVGSGHTRHAPSFFAFARHPSAGLASDCLETGAKDTAGTWRDTTRKQEHVTRSAPACQHRGLMAASTESVSSTVSRIQGINYIRGSRHTSSILSGDG